MSRYLVVAHQTGGSPQLRREIERRLRDEPDAHFGVLVPATPVSHLFTWDDRETMDVAEGNLRRISEMITEGGGVVERQVVGSRDPMDALSDELREGPEYDGIIISTFPQGISRWLKLDLVNQARKRSGLPVMHVVSQPQRAAGSRRTGAREPALAEARTSEPEPPPARADPDPFTVVSGEVQDRGFLDEEDIAGLDLPDFPSLPLPATARDAWSRIDREENVSNLFRVLRTTPALLGPYIEMLHALWNESGLDPEIREFAILRTAAVSGSEYLWHTHVRIARELGISDTRIAAVNRWKSSETAHFDQRERAVFAFVDALAHPGGDARNARELVSRHLSDAAIIGLEMLVGFYRMTATITIAEDVRPESRFVGWELY